MQGLLAVLFSLSVVVSNVQEASMLTSVPQDYMCKIAKIESNWNPNAVNKATNSRGLFQITAPTEKNLRDKYKVIGDILDPYINALLASYLTAEHIKYLKNKGFKINDLNLYILHFFGIPDGYIFLTTNSMTLVKERFPKVYKYNKGIVGNKTVGEFKQYLQSKLDKSPKCSDVK